MNVRTDKGPLVFQKWDDFIRRDRNVIRRYVVALLFALTFVFAGILIPQYNGPHLTFIALAGTLLASIYGGVGPGLLAAIASSLVVDFFYIEPLGKVLSSYEEWAYFLSYMITALFMSWIIASLRRAYELAYQAKMEAQRAVRAREEILAVITHDLRNPLSSIQLNLELLERRLPTDQTGLKLLHSISHSSGRMNRLIDDLLDASRVDTGTFTVKAVKTDLITLIRTEAQEFETLADNKGIHLEAEIQDQPLLLTCDPKRILQVIGNLLGNAVKYTPEGGVIIIALKEQTEAVEIRVTDTGAGIAENDLPRIFERSWQAKDTSHLGAGLGLYISRAIIQAHGGKIWAESTVGKGSSFHVVLPKSKSSGSAKKVA